MRSSRLDARPGHDKDSVLPMPCRRAGRFARRAAGTLRAGFKAVIGTKDNCRFRTGELEQALQHHVVKAICASNDILVQREILLLDPRRASAGDTP